MSAAGSFRQEGQARQAARTCPSLCLTVSLTGASPPPSLPFPSRTRPRCGLSPPSLGTAGGCKAGKGEGPERSTGALNRARSRAGVGHNRAEPPAARAAAACLRLVRPGLELQLQLQRQQEQASAATAAGPEHCSRVPRPLEGCLLVVPPELLSLLPQLLLLRALQEEAVEVVVVAAAAGGSARLVSRGRRHSFALHPAPRS